MELHSIAASISEPSDVGHARRMATSLMARMGLDDTAVGHVAIIVTELANNVIRHGGGGQLLLRPLASETTSGLEVLALDKGRGMRSVPRCLEDGYSTIGTAGTGLGAVQRLSSVFDVYSQAVGTAVLSRMEVDRPARASGRLQVGSVSVPKSGEEACGDAWEVLETGDHILVAMADGLGHGASAAIAAQEAMRIARTNAPYPPAEVLELAHTALRSTRGAAMAVALLDGGRREVRYAGIGNIAAVIISPDGETRNLVSHNGTIGHQMRKVQEFTYDWPPGSLLIMNTDGLSTQWRLASYPGLAQRHPSLIAGVLYRDFERGSDDATVLVVADRNGGI